MPSLRKAQQFGVDEITAQRATVIDTGTGSVLLEKNAAVRGEVASIQKLLTALTITRAVDLDTPIEILPEDKSWTPSQVPMQLGLSTHETYTRRELLIAMLVGSANEAAHALARDNAGSVAAFVEKMNDVAAELSMKDSHFINPTGLPDARQFSSARDIAKLAKAVDNTTSLREIVRMKGFRLKRRETTDIEFQNTNRLLQASSMCDGMKTGFTRSAGYCLVSSGEARGRRRLVVVLNSGRNEVWADSQKLLEGGLYDFGGRAGAQK